MRNYAGKYPFEAKLFIGKQGGYKQRYRVTLRRALQELALGNQVFMMVDGYGGMALVRPSKKKTRFAAVYPHDRKDLSVYMMSPAGALDDAYRSILKGMEFDVKKDPGSDLSRWMIEDPVKGIKVAADIVFCGGHLVEGRFQLVPIKLEKAAEFLTEPNKPVFVKVKGGKVLGRMKRWSLKNEHWHCVAPYKHGAPRNPDAHSARASSVKEVVETAVFMVRHFEAKLAEGVGSS